MIRLVVSDVDGTLITHEHVLLPESIAAAKKLRAAGVLLCVVSSRPVGGLAEVGAALGLDTPRAGFNGGFIVGADGKTLVQHTIPEAACRRAVAALQQAGADIWAFDGDDWLLTNPRAPHLPREQHAVHMPYHQVPDLSPYLSRVHKVMGSSDDFSLMARLEAELRTEIGDLAMVARSQSYYLDITDRQANKGDAALALAKLLNIEPAEMACIGDAPNDLPMFAVAGLSIAMGNASDDVKSDAKAVTADNNTDGWAQAIERFVLGK